MIRRSQATHKDSHGKSYGPGHYDLVFSDGRVEHFSSQGLAKKREEQVNYFKNKDK